MSLRDFDWPNAFLLLQAVYELSPKHKRFRIRLTCSRRYSWKRGTESGNIVLVLRRKNAVTNCRRAGRWVREDAGRFRCRFKVGIASNGTCRQTVRSLSGRRVAGPSPREPDWWRSGLAEGPGNRPPPPPPRGCTRRPCSNGLLTCSHGCAAPMRPTGDAADWVFSFGDGS